eukprot:scaffold99634_cov26-Cyclotella_meneghiniana.AAC.1
MLEPATSIVIGYGHGSSIGSPPFVEWGGDNNGIGAESVLINIQNFRDNYPGEEKLTLDLRAMWWGTVGSNPVVIAMTSYAGGSMVKDGYTWNNPTATDTYGNFDSVEQVLDYKSNVKTDPGQRISTVTINFVA